MRKKLLFISLLFISLIAKAQVTFDVSAIEVDKPVTITVDINSTATNCNGLSNPAKVYMHAGIGNKANAFGFNVIGNWGQDDGVGLMTNNGNGTYSITITPQTYFNLSPIQIQTAAQMGMVFRNATGSQTLKLAPSCGDFFFMACRRYKL